MIRTSSVLVRIDRAAGRMTLTVTGDLTPAGQQELNRMTERAQALFPDTAVTVDLSSARVTGGQDPEWENTNHRGDGEPEISNPPAEPVRPADTSER